MKFTMDSLGVDGFGIELKRKSETSAAAEVRFGPSEGVEGFIEVADGTTHLNMRTVGPLRVDGVGAPMGGGAAKFDAPLLMDDVDMDLRITGPITDGHTSVKRVRADAVKISIPGMDTFAVADLGVVDLKFVANEGDLRVTIDAMNFALLPIMMGAGSAQLEHVRLKKVVLTSNPRGEWHLEVARLDAERVSLNWKGVEGSFTDVTMSDLSVGSDAPRSVEVISVGNATVGTEDLQTLLSSQKPQDQALPASGPSPEFLALLDLLSGTIKIDLVTAVDLPVLPSWRAHHPVNIRIDSGTVGYESLEKSIGNLADAVLDFHVEEGSLKLDKDIPFVPCDRQTLMTWPLPRDEYALADRGRVRLARLAQPLLAVKRQKGGKDQGVRFLEEIVANEIDVSLEVAPQEDVRLPHGGSLRLGAGDDSPGIESLGAKGKVTYRPDQVDDEGLIRIGLRNTNFALRDVLASAQRIGASVHVDTAALNLHFLDIAPSAFQLTLQGVRVGSLVLTPSVDPAPSDIRKQHGLAESAQSLDSEATPSVHQGTP